MRKDIANLSKIYCGLINKINNTYLFLYYYYYYFPTVFNISLVNVLFVRLTRLCTFAYF